MNGKDEKKPAEKKTEGKKSAEKKPAEKKTEGKKSAEKKPAEKKTVEKAQPKEEKGSEEDAISEDDIRKEAIRLKFGKNTKPEDLEALYEKHKDYKFSRHWLNSARKSLVNGTIKNASSSSAVVKGGNNIKNDTKGKVERAVKGMAKATPKPQAKSDSEPAAASVDVDQIDLRGVDLNALMARIAAEQLRRTQEAEQQSAAQEEEPVEYVRDTEEASEPEDEAVDVSEDADASNGAPVTEEDNAEALEDMGIPEDFSIQDEDDLEDLR